MWDPLQRTRAARVGAALKTPLPAGQRKELSALEKPHSESRACFLTRRPVTESNL